MDNNVLEKTEETEEKPKFSQIKNQYLAVFIVNCVVFCQGYNAGWLSPSLRILQSENSPLNSGPITVHQTMLLGVLSPIGGLIGTIMFSALSHYLGRTNSIRLLAFPHMIFLIILIASKSIEVILIGRLIDGLTMGGMYVCVALYISEISDKRIRGFLLLTCCLVNNFGVLVAYVSGTFLDYDKVPYVVIVVPAVFLVGMAFLPETPSVLLRQNKIELAKKSLQFYYNGNNPDNSGFNTDSELNKLQIVVNEGEQKKKQNNFKLIFSRNSLKAMGMALCLLTITVLSGTFAITTYASHVFNESNANFDANISAIIMGVLQLFGAYVSSMLIDRWGRRMLFGLSSFLSGIGLVVFGTFSYLNYCGLDMSSVYWLPVTSVSFFIFVNGAGMRPLPFVYVAEVLPNEIRNTGTTICMLAFIGFTIISVGTLPILIEVAKLHTLIWIYGGICFLGVFFTISIMEETKGKSLNGSKS